MWTVEPLFDSFTFYVCLFCSRIIVSIMEFNATVKQVRDLASYKARFNPPLLTSEKA